MCAFEGFCCTHIQNLIKLMRQDNYYYSCVPQMHPYTLIVQESIVSTNVRIGMI